MFEERELVLEIDRLRHQQKNESSHKRSKPASDGAFDAVVRDVEEERDYWKNEVQVLQEILNSKLSDSVSSAQSKSSSPREYSTSSAEDKVRRPLTSRSYDGRKVISFLFDFACGCISYALCCIYVLICS